MGLPAAVLFCSLLAPPVVFAASNPQPLPSIEQQREAVRNAPTDPRARLELGRAYNRAEEYDLAMSELVEAIRLNPENRDNLTAQANFHLGLSLLAIDRVPMAINAFREAQKLGLSDPDLNLALGQAFSSQGRFEEAIAQYRELQRLSPGSSEADAGLGLAMEGAGRVDEAIAHYERYLKSAQADEHGIAEIKQRLTKLKERRKM